MKQLFFWGTIIGLAAALVSCEKRPAPPKPGTPAFYWATAQEAYRAGDYARASTNLVEISRTTNEYTARARPWHIVLTAGMASGYSELAEAYAQGAKLNRAMVSNFRRQTTVLRSMAAGAAIEFVEAVHVATDNDKDPMVAIAFPRGSGPSDPPMGLKKVASGAWLQDSEREALQAAMVQRGVRNAEARFLAGSPPPQGEPKVATEPGLTVPRSGFFYAAAAMLHEQAALFSAGKLNQPKRLQILCQQATETLQSIPETPDTRALSTRIQNTLKKAKTT